jgi:hypothetical protein
VTDGGTLILRVTVVGGKRWPDDYTVIWHSLPIGRIMLVPGLPPPGRAMRAYHTSGHLPVAVAHAFVLKNPTTPTSDDETIALRATVIGGKCWPDAFVIWRDLPMRAPFGLARYPPCESRV